MLRVGVRWPSLITGSNGQIMQRLIRQWSNGRRTFASVSSHDERVERLDIVCGSSGSITVDLYNSSALINPTKPLIIHLPPTGTHLNTHHPSIPPFLFHPNSALASINYRWNIPTSAYATTQSSKPLSSHPSFATHAFPTPLHDIFHAYTYLTTSLLSRYAQKSEQGEGRSTYWNAPTHHLSQIPRPILVYGSYLGGTLATSLALTESFSSKRRPTCISGLIAKNAMLDWTEIATTKAPLQEEDQKQANLAKLIREQQPWTKSTLHALKQSLFNNPASCFDNFVSPTLFFYSASTMPPAGWVTEDDEVMHVEDMLRVNVSLGGETRSDEMVTNSTSPLPAAQGKRVSSLDVQTTRPAHLKFPPRDSGLRIPRSLFLVSSFAPPSTNLTYPTPPSSPKNSPSPRRKSKKKVTTEEGDNSTTPQKQAKDMARLMRRSVVLHEFKERAMYDSDCDPHGASEERVRVLDVGMGEEEGEVVREWISESLGL